jgi:hypothetical protein
MNKNLFFTTMVGVAVVLMMAACPEPKPEPDEWDTTGYENLRDLLDEDGTGIATVSPGKKFFIRGHFLNIYGTDVSYRITPTVKCKINIDTEKFLSGYVTKSLNSKADSSSINMDGESSISMGAGQVLRFRIQSNKYALSGTFHWMICFSVEAEE